ncbi:MAG: T9SS type A sorting domain-containing protein [Lewinella sp.]|nr:T9SS type A sorting domain-containing protein [Lewinella sp.]
MLTLLSNRTAIYAFFFISGFSAPLAAQCTHPDVPALASLYDATNGDDWTDNSGWFFDCAPCGWAGVSCDADNRVISIILRDRGLTGTLPAAITGLDKLELLSLGRNQIGGTIPAALFSMPSLTDINLSRNQLTGPIPATLGNQPNLEYLRLSENQLTGVVPSGISGLTQLRIVMLEDNQLTGAMPEGLGDFPNLITLNLTNNKLEGCFPTDLRALCGRSRILFGGNDKMTWKGDFLRLCDDGSDETQIGQACDDGNPDTGDDVITEECGCLGGVTEVDGLTSLDGFIEEEAADAGSQVQQVSSSVSGSSAPNSATQAVAVHPNPVVGNEITVTLLNDGGNSTLRLLSLTGRELLHQTSGQTSTVINLPILEAGIYFVEVITEGSRFVKRVIVQ